MIFSLFKRKKTISSQISPEDVFFEGHILKEEERYFERSLPVPLRKGFLILPVIAFLVFSLVALGRIVYLQTIKAGYYHSLAEESRARINWIKPHRGIIYDRYKKQLVYNIPIFDLVVVPEKLPSDKQQREELIKRLINLLNKDPAKLRPAFEKAVKEEDFTKRVLEEDLKEKILLEFEAKKEAFPGIVLRRREARKYANGPALAHVLGYMGKISPLEYKTKRGYLLDDYVGKSGLEAQYEDFLRGKLGIKKTETSPLGKTIRPLAKTEPKDGYNLISTIDFELQEKLYETLEKKTKELKAKGAAALALDPRNGEVLALVSLPSYNSTSLSQGVRKEEFEALLKNPQRPFFNRAISGTYPPGSTFKPVVGLAALEEKIVDPRRAIYDKGYIRVKNIYNPNIIYTFRDWRAHGWVDFRKAIAWSCNVYFYTVGGGFGDIKGLGIKKIIRYAESLGLGEVTGIDLRGEMPGLLPNPEWKKKAKQEEWYIGDTYNISIGQGDLMVTPLQVAYYFSFFANGGSLYRPHLVKRIEDSKGKIIKEIKPENQPVPSFEKENIEWVRQGLRDAVLKGSAKPLQALPVSSAGKTGTAQFGVRGKSHGWFAAFAPFKEAEIVIVVVIEDGGNGSSSALPVVKEVLKWYFENKGEA